VNWVFVTNLTPDKFGEWISGDTGKITLGHILMKQLIGATGANVMSVFMIIALLSATSAMTMIGPRVYAAMARDGYLPRALAGKEGRPPVGALLLQAGVALFCIWTQSFIGLLGTVGAILTFSAALTALGVVRMQIDGRFADRRPGPVPVAAALVFVLAAAWMLYFAFTSPLLNTATVPGLGKVAAPLVWLVFLLLVTGAYVVWTAVVGKGGAARDNSRKPSR
jgi:amino acid transporter